MNLVILIVSYLKTINVTKTLFNKKKTLVFSVCVCVCLSICLSVWGFMYITAIPVEATRGPSELELQVVVNLQMWVLRSSGRVGYSINC